MQTTTNEMYGISKDGAAPYVYFSHDPKALFGYGYGTRLLAVNRKQQPGHVFEIVGPFTETDREWHLAHSDGWDA